MLKVVLDTSVFVSSLLSKNPYASPAQILKKWQEKHFTLIMSPQLLEELLEKLSEKQIDENILEQLVTAITSLALHIEGAITATYLDNIDPDDNIFLAAAYESKADYLVSLDAKHLLPIKYYHGTQIVTPKIFLDLLDRKEII